MKKKNKYEDFLRKFFITISIIFILVIFNLWNSGKINIISRFFQNPKLQVFTIVTLAILLEAFPFILIGSIVSGAIEVFISEEKIEKMFPENRFLSVISGAFLGIFFPVCSCGNVVVAKRLLKKGIPIFGVFSYMLCSPIINPITILSTLIAFSNSKVIVFGRVLFTFIVVFIVSSIIFFKNQKILKEQPEEMHSDTSHHSFSKIEKIFYHAESDFLLMGRYLVFGAVAAGLFQTFISRETFLSLASNKLLSVFLMQILGISLSLCSFADAFVASSFTNLPFISKIVFMVIGPMMNITVTSLYLATFKKDFVIKLILTIFFVVLIMGFIAV